MDQIARDPSESWMLGLTDKAVVATKRRTSQLSFAVLLLFYRSHGRFPRRASEIELETIVAVAGQIGAPIDVVDLGDRTLKRHRAEIRALLGFREATVADGEALTEWLSHHAVADSRDTVELTCALERRCRVLKIEPPGADRIERIVRAALHAHDERFCADIHRQLPSDTRTRLDALLRPAVAAEQKIPADDEPDGPVPAVLSSPGATPPASTNWPRSSRFMSA